MNNYELLAEKVSVELQAFEKSYENMQPVQIYNDWYIIGFYNEYAEMLTSGYLDDLGYDDEIAWLLSFEYPLQHLFDEWLSADGAFSHDWDDMLDWLHLVFANEKSTPALDDQIQSAESLKVDNTVLTTTDKDSPERL